jgi:hypothetical protein
MSEVRYMTDQVSHGPLELVIRFTDEGVWWLGSAIEGADPASWVIIDPETAPAPVSGAISDLFHGIRNSL